MKIENVKYRMPNDLQPKNANKKLRVSAYTEDYKGEYYNISVLKLLPFKNQARKIFDNQSLEKLASTIQEHGIRQPLTIIPSEEHEGKYEIVSGERRYRAALIIGLDTVPCIILRDRHKAEEIAIIENIQRENLHPIELMKAYNNLLEHRICQSTQEIANKIGIAKSSVIDILNLQKLSKEVSEVLLQENISNRNLLRLLCKEDAVKQYELLIRYRDKRKIQLTGKKIIIIDISLQNQNILLRDHRLSSLSTEQKHHLKQILTRLIEKCN